MNLLLVALLFIFWRFFDFLIIFISQKIIPYLGFFPYASQLPTYHLPGWISALANFDGLHYTSIARQGYGQYEQAFFPLYPLLIKYLSPLFSGNYLLIGVVISNISLLLTLIIFYKYLNINMGIARNAPTIYNYFQPFIAVLFLLAFPTSFFFGAVYTEGLFFLLLICTLYFLKKENYLLVAVFLFLASLTRLIGVFLIIPILFHWLSKYRKTGVINRAPTTIYNYFQLSITLLTPIIGLAIYCFYLWKTTGDPLFFLSSQPAFGANRSASIILLPQVYWRYIKIFITADHNFQFYISVLEFLIFNFVFIILILDLLNIVKLKINKLKSYELRLMNYDKLGLNLFSFINLILPTLTGTLSSIPRYSLLSISFFIYISQIKSNFIKNLILIIFVILHIILLGYFTQGYFIS